MLRKPSFYRGFRGLRCGLPAFRARRRGSGMVSDLVLSFCFSVCPFSWLVRAKLTDVCVNLRLVFRQAVSIFGVVIAGDFRRVRDLVAASDTSVLRPILRLHRTRGFSGIFPAADFFARSVVFGTLPIVAQRRRRVERATSRHASPR